MLEILKIFVSNPFLYFGALILFTAMFVGFIYLSDKHKGIEELDFEDDDIEIPERVEKPLTEDQIKARAELDRVIMQMEQDLNTKENTVVDQFEQEQEENAIISYQELLRTVQKENKEKEKTEIKTVETEKPHNNIAKIEETEDTKIDVPIVEDLKVGEQMSIDDLVMDQEAATKEELEELLQTVEVEEKIEEPKPREQKKQKEFHNTSFISPVFGVVDNKIEYPKIPSREKMAKRAQNEHLLELEKTLNLEPITEEIRKNDAFLQALKEFRKNLD